MADPEHDAAGAEVLADHRDHLDEAAGLIREPQQRGAVDRRDHGRRARVCDLRRAGVRRRCRGELLDRDVPGVDLVDDGIAAAHQRAQDAADLRALERALDERDEGPERHERERSPKSDGGDGHEVAARGSASWPIVASATSE